MTAAGSSLLTVSEGSYDLFVEHLFGSRVRVDYVRFEPADTSVEPIEAMSWGTIKSLFR